MWPGSTLNYFKTAPQLSISPVWNKWKTFPLTLKIFCAKEKLLANAGLLASNGTAAFHFDLFYQMFSSMPKKWEKNRKKWKVGTLKLPAELAALLSDTVTQWYCLGRSSTALHDIEPSDVVAWWEAQIFPSTLQYFQHATESVCVYVLDRASEKVCLLYVCMWVIEWWCLRQMPYYLTCTMDLIKLVVNDFNTWIYFTSFKNTKHILLWLCAHFFLQDSKSSYV